MDNLEDKLGAILSDPEMMRKIQAMAQSLGQQPPASPPVASQPPKEEDPGEKIPDLSMLKQLSGLAGQTGVDPQQQALLQALHPYLSHDRLRKLENAMRAAKMARFASAFLGNGGLQLLSGR